MISMTEPNNMPVTGLAFSTLTYWLASFVAHGRARGQARALARGITTADIEAIVLFSDHERLRRLASELIEGRVSRRHAARAENRRA
jgi:hypothetical protein